MERFPSNLEPSTCYAGFFYLSQIPWGLSQMFVCMSHTDKHTRAAGVDAVVKRGSDPPVIQAKAFHGYWLMDLLPWY
jgi:hypothetical protein